MKNKFFVQKTKTTRATSTKNIPDIFIPLVLLVVFAGISPVFGVATNYYIAPWGDDANPGTSPQAPFKTIQRCSNVSDGGINCLIMPGEYYERCTLQNGKLEPSTLSGTVECTHDSTVVTIIGGTFSTDHVGFFIRCPGELGTDLINHRVEQFFPWTEIKEISPSGTSLTLLEPYRGPTATTTVAEVAKFYRYKGVDSSGNDTNNPEGVRIMAWFPETLTDPALVFTKYQGADCPTCQNEYFFDLPATTDLVPPLNLGLYTGIMQGPGPEGDWENVPRPFKSGMGQEYGTEPYFNWKKLLAIGSCDNTLANLLAFTDKWPGSYFIDGNRWYFNMRGAGEPTDDRSTRDWIYVGKYQGIHPENAKYLIIDNLSYYGAWAGGDDTPAPTAGFVFQGTCSSQNCGHILVRNFHHHGVIGGSNPTNFDIRNYSNFVYQDSKFFWGLRAGLGDYSGLYNVEIRRGTKNDSHAGGSTENNASTIDRVYVTSTITRMNDFQCSNQDPDSYNFSIGPPINSGMEFGADGLMLNEDKAVPVKQYGYVLNSITEYTWSGFEFFTAHDFVSGTGVTHWLYNTGGRRYDRHSAADTKEQRIWPDSATADVPGAAEIIGNALYNELDTGCINYKREDSLNASSLDYNHYLDKSDRQGYVVRIGETGQYLRLNQIQGAPYYQEPNGAYHANLDPLTKAFVDPEPDGDVTNYRPSPKSPLVDSGKPGLCPAYDFYGRPRTWFFEGPPCDAGAIAYEDPGEVSDLRVVRTGSTLTLGYTPGCLATDNDIYVKDTPDGNWTSTQPWCGIGNTGAHAGFDPGGVQAGAAKFFVIVARHQWAEGSYGQSVVRGASGFICTERPAFTGTGGCGYSQSVNPASGGCLVRTCP